MRTWIIVGLFSVLLLGLISGVYLLKRDEIIRPLSRHVDEIVEKPLEKYTFERLQDTVIPAPTISIGRLLKDDQDFASYLFTYTLDGELLNSSADKTVSGLINIPKEPGTYPVVIMHRGYVPESAFTTGEGTRRTAEELARNGFVTLAPDFLGFGESDKGAGGIENRLQTYPTALTLLASIPNLPDTLAAFQQRLQLTPTPRDGQDVEGIVADVSVDPEKVGIWGHSNGGHISLAVLAITGRPIPTVLWNPVTKPFPYSILFFTDEDPDEGKALRKVVSDFEAEYDVLEYSPTKYYDWITAPIQLHQAGADTAVPQRWSDQFFSTMERNEKEIEYFTYPGEDHNFNSGSWTQAVERTVEFFTTKFEEKE